MRFPRHALVGGAVIATLMAVFGPSSAASAHPAPESGVLPPAAVVEEPAPAPGTPEYAQWYATRELPRYGWAREQMACLRPMWIGESHWDVHEVTGPYVGIPQTTPGVVRDYGFSMDEYRSSAEVQVTVGLRYIKDRYGSPCAAWDFWKAQGASQDAADPEQWWGGWY